MMHVYRHTPTPVPARTLSRCVYRKSYRSLHVTQMHLTDLAHRFQSREGGWRGGGRGGREKIKEFAYVCSCTYLF